MSSSKSSSPRSRFATLGAVVLGLGLSFVATVPASASRHDPHNSSIDDPSVRALQDPEVFGFDISSVPNDATSLAAFRASLDSRTQLAIANRCRYDIAIYPQRYSPKVRLFCFGY